MGITFCKFIILFLEIGGIKINKIFKKKTTTLGVSIAFFLSLLGWFFPFNDEPVSIDGKAEQQSQNVTTLDSLPTFDGRNDVVSINENNPSFTEAELSLEKMDGKFSAT